MFCTQCGTENSAKAGFCQKCGAQLSMGGIQPDVKADTSSGAAIWNPNAAANWSLILTPAFGSYLQMLNWKALGQPAKAASAKVWFFIGLIVLAAVVAINVMTANEESAGRSANGLLMLYLLIWYFAAGRTQAKYVKANFASTYPRRSWIKPILIGAIALAGYTAIVAAGTVVVVGQLGRSHLVKAEEPSQVTTDEGESPVASVSEPVSPSLTLAAGLPDCASAEVKKIITNNYADQLAEAGVPDLMFAIARERVKFRVEMITEAKREETTGNVKCSGQLVVEFPQEDLDRAAQTNEAKIAQAASQKFRVPTDPIFRAMLTYTVSSPIDQAEKKDGPIVRMTMTNGAADGERLGQYIASYTMLAYATPDITPSSKNDKKWDKEWKEAAIHECAHQSNPDLCRCKMDQFERVVSQDDMHRIGYSIQTNPLLANKFINFVRLSESLNTQCPAATNGDSVAISQ